MKMPNIHKFSLCQNLMFEIEKQLNLKKKSSQGFIKGVIPKKKLISAIFLFIKRF